MQVVVMSGIGPKGGGMKRYGAQLVKALNAVQHRQRARCLCVEHVRDCALRARTNGNGYATEIGGRVSNSYSKAGPPAGSWCVAVSRGDLVVVVMDRGRAPSSPHGRGATEDCSVGNGVPWGSETTRFAELASWAANQVAEEGCPRDGMRVRGALTEGRDYECPACYGIGVVQPWGGMACMACGDEVNT